MSITVAPELDAADVKVYPNSFTSILHLTAAEGCTLKLINTVGTTVHIQNIENPDETVWLENLPEGVYSGTFFRFLLSEVQHYKDKKVYMISDNVRFHHVKRLNRILKRYAHRTALLFLSPYSHGLNPVERVWWK